MDTADLVLEGGEGEEKEMNFAASSSIAQIVAPPISDTSDLLAYEQLADAGDGMEEYLLEENEPRRSYLDEAQLHQAYTNQPHEDVPPWWVVHAHPENTNKKGKKGGAKRRPAKKRASKKKKKETVEPEDDLTQLEPSPFVPNVALLEFGTVARDEVIYLPRKDAPINEADAADREREARLAQRNERIRRKRVALELSLSQQQDGGNEIWISSGSEDETTNISSPLASSSSSSSSSSSDSDDDHMSDFIEDDLPPERRTTTRRRTRTKPKAARAKPPDTSAAIPSAVGRNQQTSIRSSESLTEGSGIRRAGARGSGSYHTNPSLTTSQLLLLQPSLQPSSKPKKVEPDHRTQSTEEQIYLLRVHLPRVDHLPTFIPDSLDFWLRLTKANQIGTQPVPEIDGTIEDLKRNELIACQMISSQTTMDQLLLLIQERLWANCGVKADLEGLSSNDHAPHVPHTTRVQDIFTNLTTLPLNEFQQYQLQQTTIPQMHRVTYYHPSEISGVSSKRSDIVHQKVSIIMTELTVRAMVPQPTSMRERYQQLCHGMKMSPHPYLLEAIDIGISQSHSFAEEPIDPSAAPVSINLDRPCEYLTSRALQPFLLSLDLDAGQLQRLELKLAAFDDDCAAILTQLLLAPTQWCLMQLQVLSFSHSSLSIRAWKELLPSLDCLNCLSSLDFSYTQVGDACVDELAGLLGNITLSSLETLNFSHCPNLIGASRPQFLADVLTRNLNVSQFVFDSSPLTHECLVHLLRFMEERNNLLLLSLAESPSMSQSLGHSLYLEEAKKSPARTAAATVIPAVPANDDTMDEDDRPLPPTNELGLMTVCETLDYVPNILAAGFSLKLSSSQRQLHDQVLQALLEFAVAYGQEREQDGMRTRTQLNLSGWLNTLPDPSYDSSTSLFLVLYQSLTSPSCRLSSVNLTNCAFDEKQTQYLRILHQTRVLDAETRIRGAPLLIGLNDV